jgi:hypothetical protein
MPINASEVQWDDAPKLDAASVQWDEPESAPAEEKKALGPWASAVVRPLARGVAALPLMAMDAGVGTRNFLTGEDYEHPSSMFSKALDSYTTPAADGVGKVAEDISSMLVGGALPAPAVANATKAVGSMLPKTVGQASEAAGYVIPPSQKEGAGVLSRTLEGIAGKTSVAQRAAMKNQPTTNGLAARAIGLEKAPESGEGWKAAIHKVRETAGAVYKQVGEAGDIVPDEKYLADLSEMSQASEAILKDFPDAAPAAAKEIEKLTNSLLRDKFDAKSAMEYLKELRSQASGNLSWNNSSDPAKRALGMAQREAAGTLEDMVVRHLTAQGNGDLAKAFESARTQIAKSYVVQGALNESTGNIAANAITGSLKKGKVLTGELGTIAKFGQAFPKAAKEVNESFPGISPWDAGFATVAGVATGNPLVAAYPLARIGLREAMTRRPGAPVVKAATGTKQRVLASAMAQMENQIAP